MILVDSCVYVSLLRERKDPAENLARLFEDDELATCGVVRSEVLRGIRSVSLYTKVSSYFECQIYLPTLTHIWEATERLAWEMDRKGFVIPLTDALIAATALEAEARVFTYDRHFKNIPNLQVLDCLP
jgi:predicted nucleic acid-binding protein